MLVFPLRRSPTEAPSEGKLRRMARQGGAGLDTPRPGRSEQLVATVAEKGVPDCLAPNAGASLLIGSADPAAGDRRQMQMTAAASISGSPALPARLGRGMLLASILLGGQGAMAIDVAPLWNFSDPAGSEQRFRQALAGASGDDALELKTQIARTYGMRNDFATARQMLADIESQIAGAGAQAQVRWFLEWGRNWASTAHRPEQITPEAREKARAAYTQAFEKAKAARLDYLAVDALHMMVVVDADPATQLAWNEKALAYMEGSSQEEARKWEGSLRNNLGYAYHLAGRYDDAIAQFRLSLAAYERAGRAANARFAHWMIARTLRHQGKLQEAIAIQLRLESEWAAAGEPDPYVFEELERLYRETGDAARADAYAARLKETRRTP